MLKKLVIIINIFVGIFTLYQASKLIDTIIEKNILSYSIDTNIRSFVKDNRHILNEGINYDASISYSPLFSIFSANQLKNQKEDIDIVDSPLLRKYELNGVILLSKDRSIALIKKVNERESKLYHKGDKLDNVEIIKIARDKVYLNDNGRTIIIPMYYKYLKKISKSNAVTPKKEISSYSGARQVKKILSRSDVENKVFNKVNQILTQIAVSPYMINGSMEGFRLVRVPRNSIVYELGARSGDIIRRVNGHELTRIDQMYKLWENIKDDSLINVDLERNKQIYTYGFEIRE